MFFFFRSTYILMYNLVKSVCVCVCTHTTICVFFFILSLITKLAFIYI